MEYDLREWKQRNVWWGTALSVQQIHGKQENVVWLNKKTGKEIDGVEQGFCDKLQRNEVFWNCDCDCDCDSKSLLLKLLVYIHHFVTSDVNDNDSDSQHCNARKKMRSYSDGESDTFDENVATNDCGADGGEMESDTS